jgi:hypothetical protein
LIAPDLAELAAATQASFKGQFLGTPIVRAGKPGMLGNRALAAAGRQPAFLTTGRREAVQMAVDPGRPASLSPQAGLRPVEDSDEDTARRCG